MNRMHYQSHQIIVVHQGVGVVQALTALPRHCAQILVCFTPMPHERDITCHSWRHCSQVCERSIREISCLYRLANFGCDTGDPIPVGILLVDCST
jgi:hypothetical protein